MVKKPVIAVLGHHDSGKTSVIENLISKLSTEGYKVASAKHVFIKGFSIDSENTDTYRHTKAGANPVIGVSDAETFVLMKDGISSFTIDKMNYWSQKADILILEGFSSLLSENCETGKIICVRSMEEYEEFRANIKGKVLAFCSFKSLGGDILRIKEDSTVIAKRVLNYIKKFSQKKHSS